MAKFQDYETQARTWATGHVVLAIIFGAVIGFILGAVLT